MAAEVGGLLINLGLDVAQIKQDVGKAQRELSGFRNRVDRQMSKMQRSFKKATSGLKGLVAVMGGAALVRNINRAAEGLEDVNRAAESLGAQRSTIQELTFTFREFRLQQDDVTDALGTLSDRAQDAKDGMKSFQEDFELVGIAVEDLRNKGPGELFELFAEKISKVEDPTRRTAAVVRIFGDDLGRKLLPMLMKGREGLEEYAEQAREVGAVQSDALVKEGAKAAKTMRELRAVLGAQFTRAVANNAEEIRTLGEAFIDIAKQVANATSEVVNFTEWISESLAATINGISANDLPRLNSRLREIQDTLEESSKGRFQLSQQRREELESEAEKLRKLIRLERERRAEAGQGVSIGQPTVTGGGGGAGGSGSDPGSDSVLLGRVGRRGRGQSSYMQDMIQIQEEQKKAREEAQKTGDTFIEVQNNIQNNQVEVNQTFERTGDIVADSFRAATREGATLRGVVQGLLRDLAQMQVNKAANNIGQSLTNALSSSFGTGTGSSGGMMSDPTPGTAGRAAGGPVRQNETYMVGENGPELFTPGKSGAITPNDKMGGGDVYNIDARGADQAAIARLERTIKAVNGSIERRAVSAVGSQRQRSFRG